MMDVAGSISSVKLQKGYKRKNVATEDKVVEITFYSTRGLPNSLIDQIIPYPD